MNAAPISTEENSAGIFLHAQSLHATFSAPAVAQQPPIPSYEAAISNVPVPLQRPPQISGIPEELPDYTVVDLNQTTFMIYGVFIYSPNGPAYHLSSLLDARISKLRIRRLRAEDITMIESGRTRNVAYNNMDTLYEAHDPPFLSNEFYISSKSSSNWPGTLQLRFGLKRWHVRLVLQKGVTPQPMLTCGKVGSLKKTLLQRKNELEPSEWKDQDGHVLATEVLKLEDGKMLPTIELSKDLNQTWRELMLALWVSRLWAGFGAGSGM